MRDRAIKLGYTSEHPSDDHSAAHPPTPTAVACPTESRDCVCEIQFDRVRNGLWRTMEWVSTAWSECPLLVSLSAMMIALALFFFFFFFKQKTAYEIHS